MEVSGSGNRSKQTSEKNSTEKDNKITLEGSDETCNRTGWLFDDRDSQFLETRFLERDWERENEGLFFEEGIYDELFYKILNEGNLFLQRSNFDPYESPNDLEESLRLAYRDSERACRIYRFLFERAIKEGIKNAGQICHSSEKYAEALQKRTETGAYLFKLNRDYESARRFYERGEDRIEIIYWTLLNLSKPFSDETKFSLVKTGNYEFMNTYENDFVNTGDDELDERIEESLESIEKIREFVGYNKRDLLKFMDYMKKTNNYFELSQTRLAEIPVMEKLEYVASGEVFESKREDVLDKLREIENQGDYLGFSVEGSFIF